jgi:O-antigen ligase
MAVDSAEEVRATMRVAAIDLGMRNAPLGSGIGSFVPMFAQYLPKGLLMDVYINHAHNEYAQWWLTGGVMAVVAMVLSLGALASAGVSLLRRPRRARDPLAAGAFVALAAVLLHSYVEYPLRTPALLATASILVAVLFAGVRRESIPVVEKVEAESWPDAPGSEPSNEAVLR